LLIATTAVEPCSSENGGTRTGALDRLV